MKTNKLYKWLLIAILLLAATLQIKRYFDTQEIENNIVDAIAIMIVGLEVMLSFIILVYIGLFGYYLFGRLTGYKLISLNLKKTYYVKENGKLVRKRHNSKGNKITLSMSIPDMKNGRIRYHLHILGAFYIYLIIALVFIALYIVFYRNIVVSSLLIFPCWASLFLAGIEGLPMYINGMPNPRIIVSQIKRNPSIMRAYYIASKSTEFKAKGLTTRDMDRDWFTKPNEDELSNPFVAYLPELIVDNMIEEEKYQEAYDYLSHLCNDVEGINPMFSKRYSIYLIILAIAVDEMSITRELVDKSHPSYDEIRSNNDLISLMQWYLYFKYVTLDDNLAMEFMDKIKASANTNLFKIDVDSTLATIERIEKLRELPLARE